MLRPTRYQHPSVPTRNLPYASAAGDVVSDECGGVLSTWQLVWTEHPCGVHAPAHAAVAFVDGIGEIVVDPHCLMNINLNGMEDLQLSEDPAAREPELYRLSSSIRR